MKGKQRDNSNGELFAKRPRWLTIAMMVTAASVLTLAGCGDNEEPVVPDEEPSPLEQDATEPTDPGVNEQSTLQQDPGLEEEPMDEGAANQSTGVDPQPVTANEGMPDDMMDEPAEGTVNTEQDEPGFGEGTDPMPGTEDGQPEDDQNTSSNQ